VGAYLAQWSFTFTALERTVMSHADPAAILASLGLKADNAGVWTPEGWAGDGPVIESVNPATGETIATVGAARDADYERVITAAEKTAKVWRQTPAPERGQAIRLLGQALRDNQDALGNLVSLEMGKIKPEGDGEVQEMIDIADFALGQSRMLYGKSMHSERPDHRMYEQWHPYGVVGVVTAFNFPVAVWAWNACLSAICGNATVWKPSPKVPLTAIAVQHICNKVLGENGYPGIFSLFVDADNRLAERFVNDQRVKLLSFTGSSQVGRQVGEKVAARMGRSLL
jgi:aldehyde dehydrogenase (NAD+)